MNLKSPIYEKSFNFAINIIHLYKNLVKQKEYIISKQILRSGTSIGANVNEASEAESKKDFVHKMAIASKEARETIYWLKLIKASNIVEIEIDTQIERSEELVRLLTSIVKTSKQNLTNH